MSRMHWGKFFWADWRSDPGLRACSAHARGVWMDCLCIAAEAEPAGFLLVNGHSPSMGDLSRLTGETEARVDEALVELERNGVFSRDRKGRIFNRRMVRDAKISKTNQKNGLSGGNPTLLKQKTIPSSLNRLANRPVKPRSQKLEARKKEGEDAREIAAGDPDAPIDGKAWGEAFVPNEWIGETYQTHPLVDGYKAAEAFKLYWSSGGKGARQTKQDWRRTWQVWVGRERPSPDVTWTERYGYDRMFHPRPIEEAA